MRRHWTQYVAATVGAVILVMAGVAIALHLAAEADQEGRTADVLGAGIEPGDGLPVLLPSATLPPQPSIAAASAISAVAPTALSLPPLLTPTHAPSTSVAGTLLSQTAPPQPPPAGLPPQAAPPESLPAVVPPQPTPTAPPATDWPDYEFAARILALVNGERTTRGLAPLEVHPTLAAAAQAYARLLVTTGSFGHESPDRSSLASRIYGAGFPGPAELGETLWSGIGLFSPEDVVSAWLGSEAHRDVILSPAFRLAGIGCHFLLSEALHARCVLDLASG